MFKIFFTVTLLLLSGLATGATQTQLPYVLKQTTLTADLNQPTSAARALDGRVFVLDAMNRRVVVFSQSGKKIAEYKGGKNIPDFYQAMSISWSDGQLYIADTLNHRILILKDTGEFIRSVELPMSVPEKYWPQPVSVTFLHERLIYTDRQYHRFCIVPLKGDKVMQQCFGLRGEGKKEFQFPFQIAVDEDDYLHIVDVINARIQVFNARGQYFSKHGRFAVDELYRPNGVAIDEQGYQYVSDGYLGTITLYQKAQYLGQLKDVSGQLIKMVSPVALWSDKRGLIAVDAYTHKVHLFDLVYKQGEVSEGSVESFDFSRKNCVACHYSWGFSDGQTTNDEQDALAVASEAMCYSCHRGVVFESRQAIPFGGQHPTVYDSVEEKEARQKGLPRDNDIPEHHPLQADGEMLCTSCHTPHNTEQQVTLYEQNENAWLRVGNKDGELCEACHESNAEEARERDSKKRGVNHPIDFYLSKPAKPKTNDYSDDPHLQKGLPKSFILGGASLGSKDQMTCQSCHQIHGGVGDNLVAVNDNEGEMCGECHKRQSPKGLKGARKTGVHPVNIKLEEPVEFRGEKVKKVVCQSCHEVHDGKVGTPLLPKEFKTMEKMCVACHERHHAKDTDDAFAKGIHPMNEELEEAVKIAGVNVKQMGCLSCHSVHAGKPNTPVLLEDHKNGQLCENCHEGKQKVVGTDHDFRVTAKKSQNQFEETPHQAGACGTCHSLHRGKGKQPYLNAAIVKDKKERDDTAPRLKVDELCMNCHQDKGVGKEKPILHYGHPYKDMILRSDEKIMPLFDLKKEEVVEIGVIACITCHDPHSWSPVNDKNKKHALLNYKKQENQEGTALNSFLLRKGVKKTFCVDCHDIEALSKYKYYHHEDKVRDIGVDYLK